MTVNRLLSYTAQQLKKEAEKTDIFIQIIYKIDFEVEKYSPANSNANWCAFIFRRWNELRRKINHLLYASGILSVKSNWLEWSVDRNGRKWKLFRNKSVTRWIASTLLPSQFPIDWLQNLYVTVR